jgi:hypothetical protein
MRQPVYDGCAADRTQAVLLQGLRALGRLAPNHRISNESVVDGATQILVGAGGPAIRVHPAMRAVRIAIRIRIAGAAAQPIAGCTPAPTVTSARQALVPNHRISSKSAPSPDPVGAGEACEGAPCQAPRAAWFAARNYASCRPMPREATDSAVKNIVALGNWRPISTAYRCPVLP